MVNISSIYFQKQKLQSIADQAALMGTNHIELNSYYRNSLLSVLNLDEISVKSEVNRHIFESFEFSDISKLNISVKNNEVLVDILLNHDLPFGFPFKSVSINATSSAKLMVD